MGMFDYIDVDPAISLPFSFPPGAPRELQTKSLACAMDRYRIAADGQLHVSRLVDEWCGSSSGALTEDESAEDGFEEEQSVTGFTGIVEMHARVPGADDNDRYDGYVECSALFVNGKLDGQIANVDHLARVVAERDETIKKAEKVEAELKLARTEIHITLDRFAVDVLREGKSAVCVPCTPQGVCVVLRAQHGAFADDPRLEDLKPYLTDPLGKNAIESKLNGHAVWCHRVEYHPTAPCCCGVGDAKEDDEEDDDE